MTTDIDDDGHHWAVRRKTDHDSAVGFLAQVDAIRCYRGLQFFICASAELNHMDWLIETSDVRNSDGFKRAATLARPAQNSSTKAIFCTDGQVVLILSKFLDLGVEQEIPTLIGVHSRDDLRAQEYLHDDSGAYQQHCNFFTTSVWSWAEDQLENRILTQDAAIFGFSNGGVFALHTGMTLRVRYSAVIAFSLPPDGRLLPQGPRRLPPIYLACGNQGPEMKIRKNMIRLARTLNRQGATAPRLPQTRTCSH